MGVDEHRLDDGVVLEAPDAGDRPVPVVGGNRREQRVQPLPHLPGGRPGAPFLRRQRRRRDQLIVLGGGFVQAEAADPLRPLLGGQPGPDRGPRRLRPAGGLIVQVPDDVVEEVAADLAHLAGPGHVGADAGNVGAEAGALGGGLIALLGGQLAPLGAAVGGQPRHLLGVDARVPHRHVVDLGAAGPRRPPAEHHARRHVDEAGGDVVGRRVVPGPHLRRRHRHHVVERQRGVEVEVGRLALRVDLPRDGELDDVVGLLPRGMTPARGREAGCFRGRPGTLGGPAVRPRDDGLDLLVAQARVVRELAEARVGEPRRHLARLDLRLDRARPRPRVPVRHQRHRRHLVRPVAACAVVEQDGADVLVVGRNVLGRRAGRAGQRQSDDTRRRDDGAHDRCLPVHIHASREVRGRETAPIPGRLVATTASTRRRSRRTTVTGQPAHRRLRLLGAQPTLQESAPFHGADA